MKLTLDETWKNCLSMWRWIAKEVQSGNSAHVEKLKIEWMNAHGIADGKIYGNCFFCGYAEHRKERYNGYKEYCPECPGVKVSSYFRCERTTYHYKYRPIAFYNKLVSLNRKRLKGKKKSTG